MVVVAVLPVTLPGLIVQLPLGKPLNSTLPVGVVHVAWVIVPTSGVLGVFGTASITTFAVATEVQPFASVTVKL